MTGADSVREDTRRELATDLNASPYLSCVVAIVSEPLVHSGESSLTTTDVIPHKVLTVFVEGVVSEVSAHIVLGSHTITHTAPSHRAEGLPTRLWWVGSRYLMVANLPSPSLYTYTLRGSHDVTNT